jgi:drug/metabolite transporter (DMT)-like permease
MWLVSLRYLLSGAALLGAAGVVRVPIPRAPELLRTALNGLINLGIGNGCLVVAEQWIPSSLAALFITTSPFWMVSLESLVPGGDPLYPPALLGILTGSIGVALLVSPASWNAPMQAQVLRGFLVLQLGCAGWAAGSILQRRQTQTAHPVWSGAIQQFATGLFFLLPALLFEPTPRHWSARAGWAIVYLAVFGSIVGYSAYLYVLDRLPITIVTLYTYVNPVVAVLLGWLLFREPFGIRAAGAMLIIFLGVALVKRFGHRPVRILQMADREYLRFLIYTSVTFPSEFLEIASYAKRACSTTVRKRGCAWRNRKSSSTTTRFYRSTRTPRPRPCSESIAFSQPDIIPIIGKPGIWNGSSCW